MCILLNLHILVLSSEEGEDPPILVVGGVHRDGMH